MMNEGDANYAEFLQTHPSGYAEQPLPAATCLRGLVTLLFRMIDTGRGVGGDATADIVPIKAAM